MTFCDVCGVKVPSDKTGLRTHKLGHRHMSNESNFRTAQRTLFISNPPFNADESTIAAAAVCYASADGPAVSSDVVSTVHVDPKDRAFALVTFKSVGYVDKILERKESPDAPPFAIMTRTCRVMRKRYRPPGSAVPKLKGAAKDDLPTQPPSEPLDEALMTAALDKSLETLSREGTLDETVCQTVRKTIEAVQRALDQAMSQSIVPRAARLVVYGSHGNGLAMGVASDLDLTILLGGDLEAPDSCTPPANLVSVLQALSPLLSAALPAHGVFLVDRGRCPLLRVYHSKRCHGAALVEVSLNNRLAIINTRLLRTYTQLCPSLPIAVNALRRWAIACRLPALGRYTLSIMLIYVAQRTVRLPSLQSDTTTATEGASSSSSSAHADPIIESLLSLTLPSTITLRTGRLDVSFCSDFPSPHSRASAATLFLSFLRVFSTFPFDRSAVSISHTPSSLPPNPNPLLLSVIDPIDPSHNLTSRLSACANALFHDALSETTNSLLPMAAGDFDLLLRLCDRWSGSHTRKKRSDADKSTEDEGETIKRYRADDTSNASPTTTTTTTAAAATTTTPVAKRKADSMVPPSSKRARALSPTAEPQAAATEAAASLSTASSSPFFRMTAPGVYSAPTTCTSPADALSLAHTIIITMGLPHTILHDAIHLVSLPDGRWSLSRRERRTHAQEHIALAADTAPQATITALRESDNTIVLCITATGDPRPEILKFVHPFATHLTLHRVH